MAISQTILIGAACALALPLAASAATQHRPHRVAHRHAPAYRNAYAPRGGGYAYPGYGYDGDYGYRGASSANSDAALNGNSFNAGAAQIPPPGTYNGYSGPGAIVLRRGLAAQSEPGVTEELFPGSKQTATGGPVGGAPGSGGGR